MHPFVERYPWDPSFLSGFDLESDLGSALGADTLIAMTRSYLKRLGSSWRLKAALQRSIAVLPPVVGDPLYHRVQGVKGLEPNAERNLGFIKRVGSILEECSDRTIENSEVVELGSGWFPIAPLLLLDRGATRVWTYDLNHHYSEERIRQSARVLQAHLKNGGMLEAVIQTGVLPAAINYHPRCDLSQQEVPTSIDLALSQFVLEHVSPEDIVKIHRTSMAWMKPDSLWIHWVSPGDHRSYSDSRLGPVDFLQYSAEQWRKQSGNRFAYHNRLRLPQYRELFEQAGWEVVYEHFTARDEAIASLEGIAIHEDFAHFSPQDLVAGSLWFALRKRR